MIVASTHLHQHELLGVEAVSLTAYDILLGQLTLDLLLVFPCHTSRCYQAWRVTVGVRIIERFARMQAVQV